MAQNTEEQITEDVELTPDVTIGFFNHIPFPPTEIFSQLPWRRAVLDGLTGADLIGFQRPGDAQNFQRCVRKYLGVQFIKGTAQFSESTADGEETSWTVNAGSYPISIDVESIKELTADPSVRARAKEIREELGNPETVYLGVDRLDYTKGIRHRIKAYGELLHDGELSVEDSVLIQVASPSRERVDSYRQLRELVEGMVGRINGQHDTISHTAIRYLHHGYPFEEMVALYLAADVMLVTALRDGMNLVAKEYVAARQDNSGVSHRAPSRAPRTTSTARRSTSRTPRATVWSSTRTASARRGSARRTGCSAWPPTSWTRTSSSARTCPRRPHGQPRPRAPHWATCTCRWATSPPGASSTWTRSGSR